MRHKDGKINMATLIFIILIVYVFVKVDIKNVVEGPVFQKNVSFLKNTAVGVKDKLIVEENISGAIKDLVNQDFSLNNLYDPRNINLVPTIEVDTLEQDLFNRNLRRMDTQNVNTYYEFNPIVDQDKDIESQE